MERLLDLIFPPRCVGCARWGEELCARCRAGLPYLEPPWCSRCGEPAGEAVSCARCPSLPSALDGLRSAGRYEGALREAILAFKYQGQSRLGRRLGELLKEHLERWPLPLEALAPVPLHPKAERQRGYNQAGLLAREVAAGGPFRLIERGLVRQRPTSPQTRLASLEERRRNVEGAFVARGEELRGLHLLLVDDVCTTGATLGACAAAARAAGAASVWGLTLARA
ncbi:MAG: ComF family protein [Chloroflexi bacterium]|nr:ComF family protein [Chloroflexota bacterium]